MERKVENEDILFGHAMATNNEGIRNVSPPLRSIRKLLCMVIVIIRSGGDRGVAFSKKKKRKGFFIG